MISFLRPCDLSVYYCNVLFAANPVNYSPVLAAQAMHDAMTATTCAHPPGVVCAWTTSPSEAYADGLAMKQAATLGAEIRTAKTFGDAADLRGGRWWVFIVTAP